MNETVQPEGYVNAYASAPEFAAPGGAGEDEGGGNRRGQAPDSPEKMAVQSVANARGHAGGEVPGMQYGNAGEIPRGGQYGYAGGGAPGVPYAFAAPPPYAYYGPVPPPMMHPYYGMRYGYVGNAPMGGPAPAAPPAEAKHQGKSTAENPAPQTESQPTADAYGYAGAAPAGAEAAPSTGEAPGQNAAGNRQQGAPAWTPEQAQAYAAGLAAAGYAPFAAQGPPQAAAEGGHHCRHGASSENGNPGQNGPFDPFGFQAMFGGASPFGAGAPQHAPGPRETERRFGQAMEIYSDFMQGKSDPSKIMDFITSTGAHFWKGAAVGVLLTLILTNSTVKSTIGEAFSGLFGKGGGSPEQSATDGKGK